MIDNTAFVHFYPRPPRGGRRCCFRCFRCFQLISIHALREEGDLWLATHSVRSSQFLSTPSARRATLLKSKQKTPNFYFYPRPPRGGRRPEKWPGSGRLPISIHALREEGDHQLHRCKLDAFDISIHALREEGDEPERRRSDGRKRFLSTPSARRATSVCAGDCYRTVISIHAARRATPRFLAWPRISLFLSTPSARRATQSGQQRQRRS
mgnify:CR=1 FL=1